MAATQSLMTLSSASVQPAENPIFIGDSLVNTEDAGARFAELMREAGSPAADSESTAGESAGTQTGNDLPGLPPRFRARDYQTETLVADSKLEEFAVTMGIDRSLARLLLSETTNDSVLVDVVADKKVTAVDAQSANAVLERTRAEAISIAIPAWPPPSPLLPTRLFDESAVRAVQGESVSGAPITPIADEDLLRWRAVGFRGVTEPMTSDATTKPDAPSVEGSAGKILSSAGPALASGGPVLSSADPAIESAVDTVPAPEVEAPVSKDLSMGRLLSLTVPPRSADSLMGRGDIAGRMSLQGASIPGMTPEMTSVTVSALSPLLVEEIKTRDTAGAATTVSELRSRAFNVGDVESADREADESSQGGQTPSDADRWNTQSFVAALASRGIDGGLERGSLSEGSVIGSVTSPSAELAASISAAVLRPEAMTAPPSAARELASTHTAPLPLPDPRMTAEDRSRTFAEAVAQRVIGQIRNENWSVSLQLEPRNMGSMDINLSLRGNEVTATVGVANVEVRAMLEAGLPRLRESLESSGLQLAGWSFGQSGQRARGDSTSIPYITQAYRERGDEADGLSEASAAAALRGRPESSQVVDLFV